ncbi:MAG: sensor histidine kinase, partial [Alphaproteobacteria bacterium]
HVIEACHRIMRDQCARAELAVDISIDADLPWVDADAGRLKQILLNLISKAVKFTAAGGRIEIAAVEEDGGVALAVADTGIGMAADDIAVALAPFGQVDGALNRRYDGTGLGLPLSKTLVELHGGRLEIESTLGAGTRVTVHLPPPGTARTAEAL